MPYENKKTVKDIDLTDKRILLRVAYDIPLVKNNGQTEVYDDTRIKATLDTIYYLLNTNCQLVLLSWLGRPGGKVVEELRMNPIAERLSQLINRPVKKLDDCVGKEIRAEIDQMKPGEVVMLENVRFHPGEEQNDPQFAHELARLGEVMVFEAFAQSHRVHASTVGAQRYMPTVLGIHTEKEISNLSKLIKEPKHPFVIILGGKKISDKVGVVRNLLKKADIILIGGGLANTFLKAKEVDIGKSLVEGSNVNQSKEKKQDYLGLARNLMWGVRYEEPKFGVDIELNKIQLPIDLLAASNVDERAETKIIDLDKKETIPKDWLFLDIGPRTADLYARIVAQAGNVFWNGPMGVFEIDKFFQGTRRVAKAVAKCQGITIVGGGDTRAVLNKMDIVSDFNHVSTGGGAALEFLAGNELPAIEEIPDK